MKKLITFGLAAATLCASTFAMDSGTQYTNTNKDEMHKTDRMAVMNAAIPCVKSAVDAREAAIMAATQQAQSAMNAALTTRGTDLSSAWSQTTMTAVKTAVKAAWANFRTTMKAAKSAGMAAKKSAWNNFRSAVKACKAPGANIEGAGAAMDMAN